MSWITQIFRKSAPPPKVAASRFEPPERRRKPKALPTGSSPDLAVSPLHNRRRSDRSFQRELLQTVVREAMIGLGVLSSHFKFKVLSVDQEGTQFLVMIDVSNQVSSDLNTLALMEGVIVQRALSQRKLKVNAVYWRVTPLDAQHLAFKSPSPRAALVLPVEAGHPPEPPATGFADTELPDLQQGKSPDPLGNTQYGDLR